MLSEGGNKLQNPFTPSHPVTASLGYKVTIAFSQIFKDNYVFNFRNCIHFIIVVNKLY